MRFDADYLRTFPLSADFPDPLFEAKKSIESQTTRSALQFVSAEYRRVYEQSDVNWSAVLTAEFDQLVDRGLDAMQLSRQFVQYLDMAYLNLLRHERVILAIDRMVSSRF